MTTYEIVTADVDSSANLITIDRDLEAEAVAQIAGLRAWFDAGEGFQNRTSLENYKWRDKAFGRELVAATTDIPALSQVNSQPALSFGVDGTGTGFASNGSLVANDDSLNVGGAYTYAIMCEFLSGGLGTIVGAMFETIGYSMVVESAAAGLLRQRHNSEASVLSGPFMQEKISVIVVGWSPDDGGRLTVRIDGTQTGQITLSQPPVGTRLRVGARGGVNSNIQSPAVGLRISHLLAFNADLTRAARGDDLSTLEAFLLAQAS